jgi:hypothetical protein
MEEKMRYPCLSLMLITLLLGSCGGPARHAESEALQLEPVTLKVDPALLCNKIRGC